MARAAVAEDSYRERKKARMRLEFVRAAVELFQTDGFEATTVDDIAARAGHSASTFYRYFGTKEDVLFGDADERLRHLKQELELGRGSGDAIEVACEALLGELGAFSIFDDEELERACLELWMEEPGPRRRYAEIVRAWEDAIAAHLAAAWSTSPDDRDCRLVSLALASVVRASLESSPSSKQAGAVARRGFDLLELGLRTLRRR